MFEKSFYGSEKQYKIGGYKMAENTYWKQFMATGRVEDYLQFKAKSEEIQSKKDINGEDSHAGFDKYNRYRTEQYPYGGV